MAHRTLESNSEWHSAAPKFLVALCALALLATGCGTKAFPPPPRGVYSAYQVGAPDVLDIVILPDPPIERSVTVRPDGMISMDLIGDVPAGGRTIDEISNDIEKRISRFKRGASVSVSLASAASTDVAISGEVRRPGTFPLNRDTRVAEAIAMVGGETMFGNQDEIRVIRSSGGEAMVYLVDLGAIRDGDLRTNILLVQGDIVYVAPTMWARVGYAINAVLFPFQPFMGIFTAAAGNMVAPGM